jgi:hypothetical protein
MDALAMAQWCECKVPVSLAHAIDNADMNGYTQTDQRASGANRSTMAQSVPFY